MVEASVANDVSAGMYASIILAEAGLPITVDNLTKLLKTAGSKDVEKTASLCANAMGGVDIRSVLSELSKPTIGSGSGAVETKTSTEGATAAPSKESAKKEKAKVESEASDEDYGFAFFD